MKNDDYLGNSSEKTLFYLIVFAFFMFLWFSCSPEKIIEDPCECVDEVYTAWDDHLVNTISLVYYDGICKEAGDTITSNLKYYKIRKCE